MKKENKMWYEGTNFDNSNSVTNEKSNKRFGITDIAFHVFDKSAPGIVCSVNVFLFGGIILEGSIYSSENFGFHFMLEQKETAIGFKTINVQVPPAVQAQILRCYATSIK